MNNENKVLEELQQQIERYCDEHNLNYNSAHDRYVAMRMLEGEKEPEVKCAHEDRFGQLYSGYGCKFCPSCGERLKDE